MKIFLFLCCLLPFGNSALKFNNYFESGMMLQRNVKNRIWGYGTLAKEQFVVECVIKNGEKNRTVYQPTQVAEDVWEVLLTEESENTICSFEVSDGELRLENVLYGDIWICSGQSNMEQAMLDIENATDEINASEEYRDRIRYTIVTNQDLGEIDDNYDQTHSLPWSPAEDLESLQSMSAICFLFARSVYNATKIPQGLVSADWGGSPIESWSKQETLNECGIPAASVNDWPHSTLWNGMINPLKRNAVTGFLWYQGESNGELNRDLYNCTFPAMISDWREEFSTNSATSPEAPFGFVQLSTWRPNSTDAGFPVIRWHQTADVGYVPNDLMKNVFMSSPLDTFDPADGLHPVYKQIAAKRLANAGLHVAYGFTDLPTNGPFPIIIALDQPGKEPGDLVFVAYDQDFEYLDVEISGFYYCSSGPAECDAGSNTNSWIEIPKEDVRQHQDDQRTIIIDLSGFSNVHEGSIGYLWRETPVKKLLGLPIYAADDFKLPSPPWKMKI